MPACSVIIVSYYTGPVLFIALKSVLRQSQLAELILVDNGNPPDILARFQQMTLTEPRLKIITGHGNIGTAKASNLGAAQATGDFLLFMHPDCLLPPGALADCMAAFDEVPGAMLAGCWLVNPDGTEQRGGRQPLLTPRTMPYHLLNLKAPARPMPAEAHEVQAISGVFMCIRKNDFKRLQGFDERFFLKVNDLDLCMRVHAEGGKVICVPRVKTAHLHNSSGKITTWKLEWHKARSCMWYFKKYYGQKISPVIMFLAYVLILSMGIFHAVASNIRKQFKPKPAMAQKLAARRLTILASGFSELPETRNMHGKTVLVTGATSQVGLCVLRRLLAANASVLAMSRGEAIPFQHERLRWVKGDLEDRTCNLDGYEADIIVHCTPLWQLPAIIKMLSAAGIGRIIAIGSTSVYAKTISKNWYEKEVMDKLKRAEEDIERIAKEKNMRWTILRSTQIYGMGLDVSLTSLAGFIRRFGFFPVYPPARGRRHPVHADDLALAVMQVVNAPATYDKGYNISGGEILTYREMLERLFKLFRKKAWIVELTILPFALDVLGRLLRKKGINGELAYRMNEDLIFFHDAAKQDFGFSPRSFLSGGIRDMEGF